MRAKGDVALNNGVALFITEWGTCESSGNGNVDIGETQKWLDWAGQRGISTMNWGIYDKAESCAALNGGASSTGGWSAGDLT